MGHSPGQLYVTCYSVRAVITFSSPLRFMGGWLVCATLLAAPSAYFATLFLGIARWYQWLWIALAVVLWAQLSQSYYRRLAARQTAGALHWASAIRSAAWVRAIWGLLALALIYAGAGQHTLGVWFGLPIALDQIVGLFGFGLATTALGMQGVAVSDLEFGSVIFVATLMQGVGIALQIAALAALWFWVSRGYKRATP